MNSISSPALDAASELSPWAIEATGLGKAYQLFPSSLHRLWAALFPREIGDRSFWALKSMDLKIRKGEVIGIIGQNGAGKSTLLQLLCGTLKPSCGSVRVQGRIAALLELGAGFNPDFTGRDNLLLNGPLLGLTRNQLRDRMDEIIEFSGVGAFIDQPVKTYSSGMFVRLAFALATSVDPDILIVDEALSVGDGEFARKSFDRIMTMRDRGTTILFCSHALYQVEAFCSRVIWLNHGKLQAEGDPQAVVHKYSVFLATQTVKDERGPDSNVKDKALESGGLGAEMIQRHERIDSEETLNTPGYARITRVLTGVDKVWSKRLKMVSGQGCLDVVIEFESDPGMPIPTAAVSIDLGRLLVVTCAVSRSDGVALQRNSHGRGYAHIHFENLSLRKGEYLICAYLADESAIHIYADSIAHATLIVEDDRSEPGLFDLEHEWMCQPGIYPSGAKGGVVDSGKLEITSSQ